MGKALAAHGFSKYNEKADRIRTPWRPTVDAASAQPVRRDVMDMRQAADYLGISADSLYRYAADGRVPAFRFGNRWRFKKDLLDRWMDAQCGVASAAPAKVTAKTKKPPRSAG